MDDDDAAAAAGNGEADSALAWLCRRSGRAYWRPSKTLARHLGVPYARLLAASTRRDDTANLVWSSVLVLVAMATRFAEEQERWVSTANAAAAWLLHQKHYVDNREALAESACALLGLRGRDTCARLLSTVLPSMSDASEDGNGGEASETPDLGDWKECFLDEPPYSAYYWNERTNVSTWRHPVERARQEQERADKLERERVRRERIDRFLPARVPINRDKRPPVSLRTCQACASKQRARDATVQCMACIGAPFLCDACCDDAHAEMDGDSHVALGTLRFVDCVGLHGFRAEAGTVEAK
jgi:hypothetical protein